MANRIFYPAQSSGQGRVYNEFELLGGGAAATLAKGADSGQVVAQITRSGTGVFVVTMKDAYNKVIFKSSDIDDTLNDGTYATIGNVANEGTSSPLQFTIYVRSAAGALADPASGRKIGVSLALRNTVSWGMTP